MTQEEKELLLQDLCARLPYGVICKDTNINITGTLSQIGLHYDMCVLDKDNGDSESCYILNCKPYLFPLSSMTDEQERELRQMDAFISTFGDICFAVYDEYGHDIIPTYEDSIRITNWLLKNHFDYRGLIEKGLAIDATGKNIY